MLQVRAADKAPTGRIGQARKVEQEQALISGEGAAIKEGAVEGIAGVEVAAAVSTEAAKVVNYLRRWPVTVKSLRRSSAGVASDPGCQVGTVKAHLFRGCESLRATLSSMVATEVSA